MGSCRATLDDVAAFLDPELVDDREIEALLFGFTWVKHLNMRLTFLGPHGASPLTRTFALLKLLFLPTGIQRGIERVRVTPDMSIIPLLRGGRIDDALDIARRQLFAHGFRPRRVVGDFTCDAVRGRRLAAALLIPVAQVGTILRDALLPDDEAETQASHATNEEIVNAR